MEILPSKSILDKYAPKKPLQNCNTLFALQAEDVFALWDAWEEECGIEQGIPFWAVVWPGCVSLARYILENSHLVCDKTVLDLGCGGGIAGIAAVRAGARHVTANDIDPVALHLTNLNAEMNKVTVQTDTRNLLIENNSDHFDVILVADMFYEKAVSDTMLEFLIKKKQQGSTIFISDGSRAYAPKMNVQLLAEEMITVNFDLEGVKERRVKVGRLE